MHRAARTTGHAAKLKFSALDSADAVDRIGTEWDELYAHCGERRFSQARYWCRRMWDLQAQQPGRRPLVIIGRADDHLCLVWPLVSFRLRLWRATQPMFQDLSDYDDILVAAGPKADEWCRQAWKFMIETTRPDKVVCRRVRAGSPLDRLIGDRRWRWERKSASPFVDFRQIDGWDQYHASLSKKTRSTNRNRRNRLARFGPIAFTNVTDPEEAGRLIDWMFEQKRNRLGTRAHSRQEKTTSDNFSQDMPFLAGVTREAFDAGELNVFKLSAGESTVAVLTGVMSDRAMMGWLFAYSPEYMSGGPGRIVVLESLAWACRNGIDTVDFLPDPEPYKSEWTDLAHAVRDVRVPTTNWGRLLIAWYNSPVRQILVSLYMRMPKSVQHLARRTAG